MASRHWLYFAGFVLTGLAFVAVALVGLLDALAVLSRDAAVYSEEFVLLAMIGEAAEWILVATLVGALALLFLVATVVSILRNTSLHRDDRLATLVERLEREYPLLRQFDVSEKVEPTAEDRKQRLKEQYVDGELSDEEFEREMERLMDDESST